MRHLLAQSTTIPEALQRLQRINSAPGAGAGQTAVDIAGELEAISGQGGSPVVFSNLGTIISSFLGVSIIVGGLATLGYMTLGAVQWITAGGDTGKIEKARTKIIQSVVGLAVLVSMFAVFGIVQYFFGINIVSVLGGGAGGGGGVSGGGGSGGSGSGGGVGCTVGRSYLDGGAGGYCTSGGARVNCVAAGVGPSKFNYVHYEPCACVNGAQYKDPRYTFMSSCYPG